MEFLYDYGFIGLFVASFLAATIIPMSSEPLLALMVTKDFSLVGCLLVAGTGNTLGGMTNYFLGRAGNLDWIERYFKVDRRKVLDFQHRIQKYGPFMALLTWIPLIGDPLAISLGYFRAPILLTFLFMAVGKFVRYGVVGYFTYRLIIK